MNWPHLGCKYPLALFYDLRTFYYLEPEGFYFIFTFIFFFFVMYLFEKS